MTEPSPLPPGLQKTNMRYETTGPTLHYCRLGFTTWIFLLFPLSSSPASFPRKRDPRSRSRSRSIHVRLRVWESAMDGGYVKGSKEGPGGGDKK